MPFVGNRAGNGVDVVKEDGDNSVVLDGVVCVVELTNLPLFPVNQANPLIGFFGNVNMKYSYTM